MCILYSKANQPWQGTEGDGDGNGGTVEVRPASEEYIDQCIESLGENRPQLLRDPLEMS